MSRFPLQQYGGRVATLIVEAWAQSLQQFRTNWLRTMLTLLGMVFGVGSVVAMVSIGEGAQQEILALIDAMGADVTHIRAKPIEETKIGEVVNESPGLSRSDVIAITNVLPMVKRIAFRAKYDLNVTDLKIPRQRINVLPVSRDFFDVNKLAVHQGRPLMGLDHERYHRVAVLGKTIADRAFPKGAIGKQIKLEYAYFEIVGVLSDRAEAGQAELPIDPAIYDYAVIIPYETSTEELQPAPPYNELEIVSVRVENTKQTLAAKQALIPALKALHGGLDDVTIVAPEEILQQKQATQAILNMVLVSIAAISLIVGGIGVMNIMLANIMERISEIGLRRAIGARRRDIRNQFLMEAIAICFLGGLVGIVLGFAISYVVSLTVNLPIAFAWRSMLLSFFISVATGVIFGLMPALRAANVNPIEALQSE